jgi:AAA ATPase containing von Willebrand factor type A (vWA) domain
LAENPRLKGTAAYRAQAYQQAIEQFQGLEQPKADDYYNLGNALAQAGDLEAALERYNQALAIEPDDEDTLHNKEIVEQALKQRQQQDGDQSDANQEQQQNGEQSNNPESEQQSGDNQNQENQDSEDQQEQDSQSEQQNAQESEQQKQQAQKDAAKDSEQQKSAEEQSGKEQNPDQQELSPEQQQQQAEEAKRLAQQEALNAEEQQAIEQWLRRIQDDPGGLLRRKFLYQYHRQNPDGEPYDNQTTEDW